MSIRQRIERLRQAMAERLDRESIGNPKIVQDCEGPPRFWSFPADTDPATVGLAVQICQMESSVPSPDGPQPEVYLAGERVWPSLEPSA